MNKPGFPRPPRWVKRASSGHRPRTSVCGEDRPVDRLSQEESARPGPAPSWVLGSELQATGSSWTGRLATRFWDSGWDGFAQRPSPEGPGTRRAETPLPDPDREELRPLLQTLAGERNGSSPAAAPLCGWVCKGYGESGPTRSQAWELTHSPSAVGRTPGLHPVSLSLFCVKLA